MSMTTKTADIDFAKAQKIEAAMLQARRARAEALANGARRFCDAVSIGLGQGESKARVWGTVFRLMNPREQNFSRPAIYADC